MATSKPDLTRVWASTAAPANVVDPDTTTPGKVASGWQAEVPPFEHFNFLQQWFTQGLAHANEQGIMEWDPDTQYPIGGLAKGSDKITYISNSAQAGNDPTSTTNWAVFILLSPAIFGAVGDSITNDDTAFTNLEAVFTGSIVDLNGKTYLVTTVPQANLYTNGNFIFNSNTIPSPDNAFSISNKENNTGAVEDAFTGGVNNTPTVSGRSTESNRAIVASNNCRSDFARTIAAASIHCWTYGNVAANLAARQSVAGAPQSANIASEECEVYGFRGINLASVFSEIISSTGANLACRHGSVSATYGANIASNTSKCGGGTNGRLLPVITAGVITDITIDDAGSGYDVANDVLVIVDRSSIATPATATYTVDGSGSITSVTVVDGGTGFTDETDGIVRTAVYIRCSGDHIANMATELCEIKNSRNSSIIGSFGATITDGDKSVALGCGSGLNINSTRAVAIASTGSSINDFGGVLLSGNNSGIDHTECVLQGRRLRTRADRTYVYGDSPAGSSLTANIKFEINPSGNVSAAGSITPSVVFTDYAEYFENSTLGEIPTGTIVTLKGSKVVPAVDGDYILGVISKTAAIICGDSQLHWAGRYLTDEWGAFIYEDLKLVKWIAKVKGIETQFQGKPEEFKNIPNYATYYTENHPKENPDFKEDISNLPRSERPNEWSCVGLMGQLRTRVFTDFEDGDFVGANGLVSVLSDLKVMKTIKSYDGNYGIVLCVRV